jgi:hypothetical protein
MVRFLLLRAWIAPARDLDQRPALQLHRRSA